MPKSNNYAAIVRNTGKNGNMHSVDLHKKARRTITEITRFIWCFCTIYHFILGIDKGTCYNIVIQYGGDVLFG